jgi:ribonuclease D
MHNIFNSNINIEEVAHLPLKQFAGKIIVADNLPSYRGSIKMIDGIQILGFDTETKPAFKKGQSHKVSLLQLSAEDTCYIFRLNKIGLPDELVSLLSEIKQIKVGLAVKDDIKALSKLKHIHPAGFIDLQNYVEDFGITDKSLKKLSALIMGFRISKSQQTSNWESEKLTEAQLIYAATDAWMCLELYKKLKEAELNHARNNQISLKTR